MAAAKARGDLVVDALTRDNATPLATGTLEVIDNQINAATATLKLKCKIPNPEKKLWPNQFVKARLLVETRKDAIVIAASAVQRGPQGTYVYLAGSDGKAQQRLIDLGLTVGDVAIVQKGLAAGESVIIEGQNQLRPGSPLQQRGGGGGDGSGKPDGACAKSGGGKHEGKK